jgi:hypothetical protein
MALQTENPPAAPSAQLVGNAFVEQYYHILHHSPESVYRFYQDSSVLSRPDSNGVMTSVTTMQVRYLLHCKLGLCKILSEIPLKYTLASIIVYRIEEHFLHSAFCHYHYFKLDYKFILWYGELVKHLESFDHFCNIIIIHLDCFSHQSGFCWLRNCLISQSTTRLTALLFPGNWLR